MIIQPVEMTGFFVKPKPENFIGGFLFDESSISTHQHFKLKEWVNLHITLVIKNYFARILDNQEQSRDSLLLK